MGKLVADACRLPPASVSDARGAQIASDLLGYDSVRTTPRHGLRRDETASPVL